MLNCKLCKDNATCRSIMICKYEEERDKEWRKIINQYEKEKIRNMIEVIRISGSAEDEKYYVTEVIQKCMTTRYNANFDIKASLESYYSATNNKEDADGFREYLREDGLEFRTYYISIKELEQMLKKLEV